MFMGINKVVSDKTLCISGQVLVERENGLKVSMSIDIVYIVADFKHN
jgi:hypothetical protein